MDVRVPRIDLDAPDLFGNDAAEDEEEDIFQTYAVVRDEVKNFSDPARRLCIVRAYKGEGKSALLRLAASNLVGQHGPAGIVVRDSANSFAPVVDGLDFSRWVREWKKTILARVAIEVGARIGMAWSDDSMALVEEAERQGFKARSVISSIIERLSFKTKVKLDPAEIELALTRLGTANPAATVQRWLQGKEPVWIFIDDVDQNFQATEINKAKVASFFVACREMLGLVPQLRIRASVRPNVWTIIKLEFEALSHIEQYITDLNWDESANLRLLARRIEGYLSRRGLWDDLALELPTDTWQRDKWLVGVVFQDPMQWGKSTRPPHVLLHTLSKHRPRWLVELSKVAAKRASGRKSPIIMRDDIFQELREFGRRRIEDTVAEFRSQCPEVEELLAAFSRGAEEFSTQELLELINHKILDHLKPRIAGILGTASAMEIASFLFQIGFFFARRDLPEGGYEHITFSERPSLLRARTNVDEGVRWEVHPVYRQALEMRDTAGQVVVPREERLTPGVIRRRK